MQSTISSRDPGAIPMALTLGLVFVVFFSVSQDIKARSDDIVYNMSQVSAGPPPAPWDGVHHPAPAVGLGWGVGCVRKSIACIEIARKIN